MANGECFFYRMLQRSEIPDFIISIVKLILRIHPGALKIIKSDNALEFRCHKLTTFYQSVGLRAEFSSPYCHEENARAEVANRILLTAGRTLLATAHLSRTYWSYAFMAAIFQHNCLPKTGLTKSPYEYFYSVSPPLSRLRIFGCPGIAHIPVASRRALDISGVPVKMLGYSPTSLEYIVQRQHPPYRIHSARDVTFYEEKFLTDLAFRQKQDIIPPDTVTDTNTDDSPAVSTPVVDGSIVSPSDDVDTIHNDNVIAVPPTSPPEPISEVTPAASPTDSPTCSSPTPEPNFCDVSAHNILPDNASRRGRQPVYTALCSLMRIFTSTPSHCCVATRSPHKGFNSYKAALLGDHSEEWKRAYAAEIAKLESVGGLRVVPRPSDVTLLPFLEVLTEKLTLLLVILNIRFALRLVEIYMIPIMTLLLLCLVLLNNDYSLLMLLVILILFDKVISAQHTYTLVWILLYIFVSPVVILKLTTSLYVIFHEVLFMVFLKLDVHGIFTIPDFSVLWVSLNVLQQRVVWFLRNFQQRSIYFYMWTTFYSLVLLLRLLMLFRRLFPRFIRQNFLLMFRNLLAFLFNKRGMSFTSINQIRYLH